MSERGSQNNMAMLGWISAGVIVAAGAVMIVIRLYTPTGTASFGWFAYQPLADAAFTPGGFAVVLSRIAVVGWIVFAVGLVKLAFLRAGSTVGFSPTAGGPQADELRAVLTALVVRRPLRARIGLLSAAAAVLVHNCVNRQRSTDGSPGGSRTDLSSRHAGVGSCEYASQSTRRGRGASR